MYLQRAVLPLCLLGFAPWVPADVTIFVGTPGSAGDVWVLNEHQTLPPLIHPELTSIHLLQIDAVGRTEAGRLLGTQPQLRVDLPEGTRVILPTGRCLYRYRRDLPGGTSKFGFFSVEQDGGARPLGEIAGTGQDGRSDPIVGRIALTSDASAFVVASTLEAGGDLYELNLDTATWSSRTALLAPLDFRPDGLCLVTSFGAALTTSGLVRYDRLPDAQATPVAFADPQPSWTGGEIICSADAGTIAFAAGGGPSQACMYVAHATGDAVQISGVPQTITDVGFLPASASGPRMALSPDGSIAAWIVQEADSRECFTVDTGVPAPTEFQLTRNQNFEDTLNDSGVIVFVSGDQMVLLAGEEDDEAVSGIEHAEVFCADYSVAGADPVISNLSRTLGTTAPPFGYGRLKTEAGIFLLGAGEILAHDPGDEDLLVPGKVISVSQAGSTTLFSQVDKLEWAEKVGTHTFAKVRMSGSGTHFRLLDVDSVGSASVSNAPDLARSRYAIRHQSGSLAAVMTNDSGGEFLGRVGVAGQGGMLLVLFPALYGPTLAFTSSGAVAASVENPGGAFFLVWPVTAPPRLLWPQPLPGFVLPSN